MMGDLGGNLTGGLGDGMSMGNKVFDAASGSGLEKQLADLGDGMATEMDAEYELQEGEPGEAPLHVNGWVWSRAQPTGTSIQVFCKVCIKLCIKLPLRVTGVGEISGWIQWSRWVSTAE